MSSGYPERAARRKLVCRQCNLSSGHPEWGARGRLVFNIVCPLVIPRRPSGEGLPVHSVVCPLVILSFTVSGHLILIHWHSCGTLSSVPANTYMYFKTLMLYFIFPSFLCCTYLAIVQDLPLHPFCILHINFYHKSVELVAFCKWH